MDRYCWSCRVLGEHMLMTGPITRADDVLYEWANGRTESQYGSGSATFLSCVYCNAACYCSLDCRKSRLIPCFLAYLALIHGFVFGSFPLCNDAHLEKHDWPKHRQHCQPAPVPVPYMPPARMPSGEGLSAERVLLASIRPFIASIHSKSELGS